MSMIITHPNYPLQFEQRAEIIAAGTHDREEIERIQRHYVGRRNEEFKGWRQQYEREIREWLKCQGKFGARS